MEPKYAIDPERDRRVTDAERFRNDRRVEALAMLNLWQKSTKPGAAAELVYWQNVLDELDRGTVESEASDDANPGQRK